MNFLPLSWPRHRRVGAAITTRREGGSVGPYAKGNLAVHVGDKNDTVWANRARLEHDIGMKIQWLSQVHGTRIHMQSSTTLLTPEVDGVYSRMPGHALAVLTADCLPLLICNAAGDEIAAVHAGWRGLAAGVITECLTCFSSPCAQLNVYLGPGISQRYFEVGSEVVEAFYEAEKERPYGQSVEMAFQQTGLQRWHADLYALARFELQGAGVNTIYGGDYCTFAMQEHFFSYRRDGQTGRFASLIWLTPDVV